MNRFGSKLRQVKIISTDNFALEPTNCSALLAWVEKCKHVGIWIQTTLQNYINLNIILVKLTLDLEVFSIEHGWTNKYSQDDLPS